jgi:hypothetical protein
MIETIERKIKSCFFKALYRGDTAVLRLLLRVDCSLVNESDDSRDDFAAESPALFWACCNGNFETIHVLLEFGADVNMRSDGCGSTSLLLAVIKTMAMRYRGFVQSKSCWSMGPTRMLKTKRVSLL